MKTRGEKQVEELSWSEGELIKEEVRMNEIEFPQDVTRTLQEIKNETHSSPGQFQESNGTRSLRIHCQVRCLKLESPCPSMFSRYDRNG